MRWKIERVGLGKLVGSGDVSLFKITVFTFKGGKTVGRIFFSLVSKVIAY